MPDTPSAGGAALSGAASGAAAGSAFGPWGTAIGAVVGGVGGYLSASGTAGAQTAQNKAAAQQAAAQSAQSFSNYLASRGINLQQIIANDPRGSDFWPGQYKIAQAGGEKGDFSTWVYKALQNAPSDPVWDLIANPAGTAGAANTTLPPWAVDAQGNPLQPSILNSIVGVSGVGAAKPPLSGATDQASLDAQFAAANPGAIDWYNNMKSSGWNGTLAQAVQYWWDQNGGTPDALDSAYLTGSKAFASGATPPAVIGAGTGNIAAPGAPGNVVNTHTLDPNLAGLVYGGGTPAATAPAAVLAPPTATAVTTPGNLTAGSPDATITIDASAAPGAGVVAPLVPTTPAAALGNGITGAVTGPGGISSNTLSNIYSGAYLSDILKGLQPVADARTGAAAAQAAKINELRNLSGTALNTDLSGIQSILDARKAGAGDILTAATTGAGGVRDAANTAAQGIYDANVAKLADLLGVRKEAAQAIYDAANQGAAGVRDARTTGAKGIYDAESLQADSYGQTARQAVDRIMAQNAATRERQGFAGPSSGSQIVDARLLAGALQQGAGARAQAGVNFAGRLSDAGVGYATDTGTAGTNRATQIGQSNEQDAAAKLNAAVSLAQSLGLAGTNYATTLGTAGNTFATTNANASEQNAIAQLQAKAADAQRRLGYLTSDADIAKANADLANATDALNAITANQNRQVSNVTLPYTLAGSDLALKGALTDQQYTDLDALLKRINSFATNPASGPALTTGTINSVLNGSQIAGGAISGIGSAIGNYSSNSSLTDLIKAINSSSNTGANTTAIANPTGYVTPGGNVGVGTDWTSVFK